MIAGASRTAGFGRRAGVSLAVPLVAVLLALLTSALLLVATGADAGAAFASMARAAVGDPLALSTTVVKAMPRLLAALGIALALRAGLWNIGAEGQLYVGAIATTAVALYGPPLAFPFGTLLALAAGILAGAAWGAIPGLLRASRGISEVITSLMLVYVAIQITNYLVEGPWLQQGGTFPASALVPNQVKLPLLAQRTLFNAGIVVTLLGAAAAWVLMHRSTFGLRLRAVGSNERAALASGVSVRRVLFLAMAISGAFAGLAGAVEVLGVRGRLIEGFSPGYGFDAIAIALLGRLDPIGITAAALLFGGLDAGGAGLATAARGVSSSIVQITAGLAVIYVLTGLGIAEMVGERRRARAALEAAAASDDRQPADPLAGAARG